MLYNNYAFLLIMTYTQFTLISTYMCNNSFPVNYESKKEIQIDTQPLLQRGF